MPIIQVNLLEGRSIDAKRDFMTAVTEAAEKHLAVRKEQVRVIFNEMKPENFAIAGTLVADRNKETN